MTRLRSQLERKVEEYQVRKNAIAKLCWYYTTSFVFSAFIPVATQLGDESCTVAHLLVVIF